MEELRFGIGWVMQRLRRADLLDEASTTAVPTDWASTSGVTSWSSAAGTQAKARIIATLRTVLLNERAAAATAGQASS
jgi:hypothetical protein